MAFFPPTADANARRLLIGRSLRAVADGFVSIILPIEQSLLTQSVGDPGDIEVFDTTTMKSLGRTTTEKGAHTTALTPDVELLYAFLPQTHRAAVYRL